MRHIFYQMRLRTIALSLLAVAASCSSPFPEAGVPYGLAVHRKADIGNVRYALSFDIAADTDADIPASETVSFDLRRRDDVFMDMRGFDIKALKVNGKPVEAEVMQEHLKLPRRLLSAGSNSVDISFTAGNQSLNRRDGFLYTLLVPDRARTLFPCFDQPDMKARYTLSLSLPDGWTAVSNTAVESVEGNTMHFRETEPLSSYLFSFVAGEFQCVTCDGISTGGQAVHLYHRETDPAKVAQCGEILALVRRSLDWLEDYTGMPYPFAKYDLIVLPDFQYGGMEHTGATLYNERRIFLGEAPTTEELVGRASLIAHETAHMWFGDYVTMKWFNDVWTKEVFANFFASKMVRPLYPDVNHTLNDLRTLYAPAYSEDRTVGSNAIQRPLDNLSSAGLIYCNIIYDKAPVMMGMLEKKLGQDAFRSGIRRYLEKFAYSNATWDDLIDIFSEEASFDVSEWSRVWVKERGMPVFDAGIDGGCVKVTQTDPFSQGNRWQEDISYLLVGDSTYTCTAVFSGDGEYLADAPFKVDHVIPNVDGTGYGWFRLSQDEALWIQEQWHQLDDTARMSTLMTLYENVWHRDLDASAFVAWICSELRGERNRLISGAMMEYAASASQWCHEVPEFENVLRETAADGKADHELRLLAFRTLMTHCDSCCDELLSIWKDMRPYGGLVLGERDYTSMAYQLMLRFPEQASQIRSEQASRIVNPDRKDAFMYVSQACSPEKAERDAFFKTLLSAETRGPESRVKDALTLLNSPLRYPESLEYITPALEALGEVQRTGDIFFPASWCGCLLSGHVSPEASAALKDFIHKNGDMSPLLMTKVLQRGGWLLQQ